MTRLYMHKIFRIFRRVIARSCLAIVFTFATQSWLSVGKALVEQFQVLAARESVQLWEVLGVEVLID